MKNFIKNIREIKPLIHCITNYVTVNDVANSIIAVGASPVMADEPMEVAQITSISSALLVNIGTLNLKTIEAMKQSLSVSKEIIRVLDPVGVGVSELRNKTALEFMKDFKFDVIKGNISEIKFLAGLKSTTKGVDASSFDEEDSLEFRVKLARNLSEKTNSVIVITGKYDVISDKNTSYICKNGNSMMSSFSGSGCILGGVISAFCAVNENLLEACLSATLCVGIAGELAKNKNVLTSTGNMSFKQNFIDEMYLMDDEKLKNMAKFEEFKGEI